jgi:cytidylate kinase|tara:strand:- start:1029 stop:1739 length:711 start_codon:yes stop_codon:yes gene_type:complete
MAIVTISGQYGSSGAQIASRVAEILAVDLIDRDLLSAAADKTGIDLEQWRNKDMRLDSLPEKVSKFFQLFLSRSGMAYLEDPYLSGEPLISRTYMQQSYDPANEDQKLDDNLFLEVTSSLIRELSVNNNLVIVGRGAPYILHENPRAFHVLVTAPEENRIEWVAENDGLSILEATKIVREREKFRQAFIRKFFKVDALDVSWFDLTLHTGRLSFEQYASFIVEGAKALDANVVGGA